MLYFYYLIFAIKRTGLGFFLGTILGSLILVFFPIYLLLWIPANAADSAPEPRR